MKKLFFMSVAFIICIPVFVCADEEPEFSFNTWMSSGQTKWRHDASMLNPYVGVPTSELDYQGVNSTIVEVAVLKTLQTGNDLRLTIGTGSIDSGTLVDDDYLSALGATEFQATQSGAHRFSRTHSDIDGNGLFYLKGEFIPDDLTYLSDVHKVQVGFGLHYWQEEYVATGVRQIECTALIDPRLRCNPVGTVSNTGETVISNKVEWTGLGIGLGYEFAFAARMKFQFDFTYYPFMSLVNEDIHHLRPDDFAQDPSVRMTGNGTGYDMLMGLKFQFEKNISAHLGYQVWERWVEDQTITFLYPDGSSATANLMNFKTHREGFMGGITVIF